jgi:hypothetical protein
MAEVTVFVDDAVRGRLPDICVKDGVPARGRLRITEEIGRSNRLGILWLLFFAGPPGWLVLLVLLAGHSSGEHLDVELPYSDAACERFVRARRLRTMAVLVGSLGGISLFLVTVWAGLELAGFTLMLGTIGVAMILLFIADIRMGRGSVGVRLDASRRWVTLRGVHPAFAAACAASEQQREQTRTTP